MWMCYLESAVYLCAKYIKRLIAIAGKIHEGIHKLKIGVLFIRKGNLLMEVKLDYKQLYIEILVKDYSLLESIRSENLLST